MMSTTLAETIDVPPMAGSGFGLALIEMRPTAADPTAILIAPSLPEFAAPDDAEIVAVPLDVPAKNLTLTRPLASVLATEGSIRPSVVVNETCVPLCGGVPAASRTCATISADPFAPSAFVTLVSVMDDPVGASSGVFSHAAIVRASSARKRPEMRRESRGTMNS